MMNSRFLQLSTLRLSPTPTPPSPPDAFIHKRTVTYKTIALVHHRSGDKVTQWWVFKGPEEQREVKPLTDSLVMGSTRLLQDRLHVRHLTDNTHFSTSGI